MNFARYNLIDAENMMKSPNMENGRALAEDDGKTETAATDNILQHHWHAVARAQDLAEKPLAVKLLDQNVVLWRSQNKVVAFHDLCVHRGTPLSLGWTESGRIVCAYHGWQYGDDGVCARIPSIPAERGIPAKARAIVYHATEKYGLIWVCLETPAAEIPEFPYEIHDPSYRWGVYSSHGQWKANAARISRIFWTSHISLGFILVF